MNTDLLHPFIKSTINVLKTMAQTDPKPGKPYIRQDHHAWGVVTGIIGMSGDTLTGNMIVSFDKESILDIASKMLMEEFTEVSQEVIDAAGEITNMITGGTKAEMSDFGHTFSMATPVMISGEKIDLTQLTKSTTIVIPFETDSGTFVVETNLHPKD